VRGHHSGNTDKLPVRFENLATVCKYVVPDGYPEHPVKGELFDWSRASASDRLRIFEAPSIKLPIVPVVCLVLGAVALSVSAQMLRSRADRRKRRPRRQRSGLLPQGHWDTKTDRKESCTHASTAFSAQRRALRSHTCIMTLHTPGFSNLHRKRRQQCFVVTVCRRF